MTIIVEDGTAPANANSYTDVATAVAYAALRGLTFPASPVPDAEAALIRATQSLDGSYRDDYPGVRANGRDQSLEWPRSDVSNSDGSGEVTDFEGNNIPDDEIPIEIINATCELAVLELADPNSTLPDLDRSVTELKAGSVALKFAANAREATVYQRVLAALAPLLGGTPNDGRPLLFGTSIRG